MKPVEEIEISYKIRFYDRGATSGEEPPGNDYVIQRVLCDIFKALQTELDEGVSISAMYRGEELLDEKNPTGPGDRSLTTVIVRRGRRRTY